MLRKVKISMINIRRAEPKDIPFIIEFQKKMAFETENIRLDDPAVETGVNTVFKDTSKGFYIIAEDDGNVIASLMLTPEWSDWRNGYFLWIQSLYVLTAHRNKGVFKKIYEFTKKLILSGNNYFGLRLYVEMNNTLAQEVYTKVGMDGNHYKMYEWMKD